MPIETPFSSPNDLELFLNALQLCLRTPFQSLKPQQANTFSLKFSLDPSRDRAFQYFKKLMEANWKHDKKVLAISDWDKKLTNSLISFLMLSRLKKENMQTLAQLDKQYQPLVTKILGKSKIVGGKSTSGASEIDKILDAAKIVFSRVEQQGLTLREVSQRSGLTQASLNNFKSGRDIRLSSLLKILAALELKLHIAE